MSLHTTCVRPPSIPLSVVPASKRTPWATGICGHRVYEQVTVFLDGKVLEGPVSRQLHAIARCTGLMCDRCRWLAFLQNATLCAQCREVIQVGNTVELRPERPTDAPFATRSAHLGHVVVCVRNCGEQHYPKAERWVGTGAFLNTLI